MSPTDTSERTRSGTKKAAPADESGSAPRNASGAAPDGPPGQSTLPSPAGGANQSGQSGQATQSTLCRPGQRLAVPQVLEALVEGGLLAAEDARAARGNLALADGGQHALVLIARQNLRNAQPPHRALDLGALTEWLAGRAGLPYLHIDPLKVNFSRVAEVMSSSYATRFRILPVEVRSGEVVIATAEPWQTEWVAELTQVLRVEIRRVVANPLDITRYIAEFYSLARSVRGAQRSGGGNRRNDFEQLVELGRTARNLDANDQHVVIIVDWLLQYAFEQRASDIHLEPRRELGAVRFRIDGVLHNVYQVPPEVLSAMTSRLKLLGRMDVVERRRPQDGRIKTRSEAGREIELRLSTLPTAFGEKLVLRIFDPEVLQRDFAELGFAEHDRAIWQGMTSRPNGIVLVTGPTGSGKTTTLYSTLRHLASEEVNVCTVEDPIEMVEPAFNQMQVQHGIDLSFADGIRALMRQDPDIIMVGEIRDLETAEMAIQAALTGHLVLSTLHTNDAPSAITRMLDLGVPPYLLNATVIGVMAQRLVRTLCTNCKEAGGAIDESQWTGLLQPFRANPPASVYRPVGCVECRMTGYRGRAGIYELLELTDPLRALIDGAPDLVAIRNAALRGGLRPLRLSGAQKIAQGLTTIEEVARTAPPAGR